MSKKIYWKRWHYVVYNGTMQCTLSTENTRVVFEVIGIGDTFAVANSATCKLDKAARS